MKVENILFVLWHCVWLSVVCISLLVGVIALILLLLLGSLIRVVIDIKVLINCVLIPLLLKLEQLIVIRFWIQTVKVNLPSIICPVELLEVLVLLLH